MREKTVAVDFDKVLNDYKGWEDGEVTTTPVPGAVPGFQLLNDMFCLFVHTSRDPEMVLDWCGKYMPELTFLCESRPVYDQGGKRVHMLDHDWERVFWSEPEAQGRVLITRIKLPAIAYLDDRAIRFTSWPQALLEVDLAVRGEFPDASPLMDPSPAPVKWQPPVIEDGRSAFRRLPRHGSRG